MFRPRKRRLYTPITPPSDDEADEQQVKIQEQQEVEHQSSTSCKIPEKM